jgi:hypothetical protein
MAWQVYVFILDCPGYPMKGKYTQGNLNNIRNELRSTIAADGRFNAQIAAWIADGSIESRWYVGQKNASRNNLGQLPICYLPYKNRQEMYFGDIHYFKDEKERIMYAHWEDRIGNSLIEQYTVLYMLTDGTDVDTSEYEEV